MLTLTCLAFFLHLLAHGECLTDISLDAMKCFVSLNDSNRNRNNIDFKDCSGLQYFRVGVYWLDVFEQTVASRYGDSVDQFWGLSSDDRHFKIEDTYV